MGTCTLVSGKNKINLVKIIVYAMLIEDFTSVTKALLLTQKVLREDRGIIIDVKMTLILFSKHEIYTVT